MKLKLLSFSSYAAASNDVSHGSCDLDNPQNRDIRGNSFSEIPFSINIFQKFKRLLQIKFILLTGLTSNK